MISNSPMIIEFHATARREQMVSEAHQLRYAHMIATGQPNRLRRVLGTALVQIGERIHGATLIPARSTAN